MYLLKALILVSISIIIVLKLKNADTRQYYIKVQSIAVQNDCAYEEPSKTILHK